MYEWSDDVYPMWSGSWGSEKWTAEEIGTPSLPKNSFEYVPWSMLLNAMIKAKTVEIKNMELLGSYNFKLIV